STLTIFVVSDSWDHAGHPRKSVVGLGERTGACRDALRHAGACSSDLHWPDRQTRLSVGKPTRRRRFHAEGQVAGASQGKIPVEDTGREAGLDTEDVYGAGNLRPKVNATTERIEDAGNQVANSCGVVTQVRISAGKRCVALPTLRLRNLHRTSQRCRLAPHHPKWPVTWRRNQERTAIGRVRPGNLILPLILPLENGLQKAGLLKIHAIGDREIVVYDNDVWRRAFERYPLANHGYFVNIILGPFRIEPAWVNETQRITENIRVAIMALCKSGFRNKRTGRQEPSKDGVKNPPVHMNEPQGSEHGMPSISPARNLVHDLLILGRHRSIPIIAVAHRSEEHTS